MIVDADLGLEVWASGRILASNKVYNSNYTLIPGQSIRDRLSGTIFFFSSLRFAIHFQSLKSPNLANPMLT